MRKLRVLLACECSGRVRDEFARRGWEAWSADLLPSETPVRCTWINEMPMTFGPPTDERKYHYQGDVRDLFNWSHPVNRTAQMPDHGRPWDLVIAFPPCTDLSYAGNRWRAQKRADGREDAGAAFFMEMIAAPSPRVAVENPRGVMFARYRHPDQQVQPYFFGDPFRKTTCLWLKGLPLLVADKMVTPENPVVTQGWMRRQGLRVGNYEDSEGRANRARTRSRTFPGFARAMAEQWGAYAEAFYAFSAERTPSPFINREIS